MSTHAPLDELVHRDEVVTDAIERTQPGDQPREDSAAFSLDDVPPETFSQANVMRGKNTIEYAPQGGADPRAETGFDASQQVGLAAVCSEFAVRLVIGIACDKDFAGATP